MRNIVLTVRKLSYWPFWSLPSFWGGLFKQVALGGYMKVLIQLTSGVHPLYIGDICYSTNKFLVTSVFDDAMSFSVDDANRVLRVVKLHWPLAQLSHAVSEEA